MSEALTLPLGERLALLPWIAWGGRHMGEMPNVIAAAKDFAATPFNPLRPWWEQFKASGDTIVGVLEDAPYFAQPLVFPLSLESLQTEELRWDGTLLRLFLESLPAIIALFERFAPKAPIVDPNDPNIIDVKYKLVVPQALLAGT